MCEMVSKVACRSSKMRMDSRPESGSRRKSLLYLISFSGKNRAETGLELCIQIIAGDGYGVRRQQFCQEFWKGIQD